MEQLAIEYNIPDINELHLKYYKKNHPDLFIYDAKNHNADVGDLLKGVVEPFCSLRIRFPAFSGNGFTDDIVWSTGS